MPDEFCVIMTTTGSREEAGRLAELLVTRKLAACVQILAIASVYTWEGQLNQDDEYLLLVKTAARLYPQVQAAILENHSYQVPEILQLPVSQGFERYLGWITDSTTP